MSCFPFGAADGFDAATVGFIAPTLKLPPVSRRDRLQL
jgi:hypothetical protein